jgi:hypothetical protein
MLSLVMGPPYTGCRFTTSVRGVPLQLVSPSISSAIPFTAKSCPMRERGVGACCCLTSMARCACVRAACTPRGPYSVKVSDWVR